MVTGPGLPIDTITAATYEVPTDRPEGDGTLRWSSTVMVVVRAGAGRTEGLGWTYGADGARAVVASTLAGAVRGMDAFDLPAANQAMLHACRNLGQPGVGACAISAVDVALWDLKARLLGVPLAALVGKARQDVPLYGSGGFTTYDDATTADQLEYWVGDLGLPRVKIKIGESWGTRERRDRQRIELARRVIGEDVELFVDANGAYGVKQAVRLGQVIADDPSVTWFEEPVSSDDLDGLRQVRDRCPLDVAAGEYGYSPWYYLPMLRSGAVDCLQADITRCGGATGWLATAQLARAHHLDISGHCAPNLHASVAIAAPNLRHVEYFHDHARIENLLLDGTRSPSAGALCPDPDAPGHGLTFKDGDAEPYRIA